MDYGLKYVDNWEETKARFTAWWQGKNIDRPLMKVVARRERPVEELERILEGEDLRGQIPGSGAEGSQYA